MAKTQLLLILSLFLFCSPLSSSTDGLSSSLVNGSEIGQIQNDNTSNTLPPIYVLNLDRSGTFSFFILRYQFLSYQQISNMLFLYTPISPLVSLLPARKWIDGD